MGPLYIRKESFGLKPWHNQKIIGILKLERGWPRFSEMVNHHTWISSSVSLSMEDVAYTQKKAFELMSLSNSQSPHNFIFLKHAVVYKLDMQLVTFPL